MIKRLLGQKDDDKYVEMSTDDVKSDERIVVQIDRLEAFSDSERVLNKLRAGEIVLVKIKHLRDKDDSEFKRSMQKIKKTCGTLNGKIGALGNDWVLLTPNFASIQKLDQA